MLQNIFKKSRIDFIVAGVQKAGTSALDVYLRKHPDIEMGDVKELHFFDNDSMFTSKVNYKDYHRHFSLRKRKKIFGECTPIYSFWEPSMERIHNYNPEIKLILILRNPIERAFSHWNMEVLRNQENESFHSCIKLDLRSSSQQRVTSYVKRGFYSEQIKRIFTFFPKEQVLILKYEEYLNQQEKILKEVFSFLGLRSENYQFEPKIVNRKKYVALPNEESQRFLMKIYLNEIEEIEGTLGWDCSDWKKIKK